MPRSTDGRINPPGVRKTHKPWTQADVDTLRAMCARNDAYHDIARALGRTYHSVAEKAAKLGIHVGARAAAPLTIPGVTLERSVREEGPAHVLAPLETAEETDDEFLARVTGETSRAVARVDAERYATLRIASATPIALSISSDWHLSPSGACDVKGLIAYADAVAHTPGAYAVTVGDLTDNPIKHKPAAVREIPDELRLLDLLLGRFRGKMLGMTSGNHDDWTFGVAGVDNLRALAKRHRIHYGTSELVYVVEIVSPDDATEVTARWIVATRHQFYRNSTLNDTHACERWLETGVNAWPVDAEGRTLLPDVLAIGHNHTAIVAQKTTPRGVVTFCRMGAWQRASAFTKQYGWSAAPATAPTVILPPTRQEAPVAYADYRVALAALVAGRARVAARPASPAA